MIHDSRLSKRFLVPVAVYLILRKENHLLLLRRFQTGFADGYYSLVAGCIDGNETVTEAMIREAKEEAGIFIKKENLKFATVMHRKHLVDHWEAICFFFICDSWEGEVVNAEPHKCDDLRFFHEENLPKNLIPYVKAGMEAALSGTSFIEYGWN